MEGKVPDEVQQGGINGVIEGFVPGEIKQGGIPFVLRVTRWDTRCSWSVRYLECKVHFVLGGTR